MDSIDVLTDHVNLVLSGDTIAVNKQEVTAILDILRGFLGDLNSVNVTHAMLNRNVYISLVDVIDIG